MTIQMEMDGFGRLPDSLILLIFNAVSDIKTLIRCRSVSKRFNSLVPQTESLVLKVDCVISSESDSDSHLFAFLRSLLKSLHDFFVSDDDGPKPERSPPPPVPTSPAQILSQFERIRFLQIELPAGDLKLDKGVVVRWRAEFGKTLRNCVILGFVSAAAAAAGGDRSDVDVDFAGGLKTRVLWTISALIAASARHYLLKEVVKGHEEMRRLVLKDRDGEGTVVMEREGLTECRLETAARGGEGWEWGESRTVVPSVSMRMRHEPRVRLKNGACVEGATLVVVRPCLGGGADGSADVEDAELAMGAFADGVYGETVQALLKNKSYLVEMNSF